MKLDELDPDAIVVTVFPDDNKKYLTTSLMKKEPVKEDFSSTHVRLKSFKALKRSCVSCCNPAECEAMVNPGFIDEINLNTCFLRNIK
jgi:cysteine synthase A